MSILHVMGWVMGWLGAGSSGRRSWHSRRDLILSLAGWKRCLLLFKTKVKIKTKTTNSSRCLRNKRPFSSWGYFERFPPGPPSTMLKRAPLTPLLQNRAFILQLKKTHTNLFSTLNLGGGGLSERLLYSRRAFISQTPDSRFEKKQQMGGVYVSQN